jgi:hypothetical protein
MKLTVELKNRAGAPTPPETALHISYFVKTGDDGSTIPKTAIHFPLTSSSIDQEFDNTLAPDHDIFLVLVLKSTSTLAQATFPPSSLREGSTMTIMIIIRSS